MFALSKTWWVRFFYASACGSVVCFLVGFVIHLPWRYLTHGAGLGLLLLAVWIRQTRLSSRGDAN